MLYIRQIMQLLSVDEATARDLIERMYIGGADFSEMTDRQFKVWVHAEYAAMIDPHGDSTF